MSQALQDELEIQRAVNAQDFTLKEFTNHNSKVTQRRNVGAARADNRLPISSSPRFPREKETKSEI